MRVRNASFGITALMTLLSSLLQAGNDPSQQQFALYEKNDRLFRVGNWYESHSEGARELKIRLRLDLRTSILRGGENKPAIEVNQPDGTLLVQAVRYRSLKMLPKGNKLLHYVITDPVKWAKKGNSGRWHRRPTHPDGVRSTTVSGYWSFQLPQRHLLPTVRDGAWTIFDLEFFILRQLEPKVL